MLLVYLVYDKETPSFTYPQTVPAGTGNSAVGTIANRNKALHGRFRSPRQQPTIKKNAQTLGRFFVKMHAI